MKKPMKQIVRRQYQDIVDDAVENLHGFTIPPEGWLKTLRNALGMSGAQLARRLGVSRSQVAQAEKNEISGAVTMKTLNSMAEAMGGRVVYAIVPERKTSDLIAKRAHKKAEQLVEQTSIHMALEDQALNSSQRQFEVDRLQRELIQDMPSDFWDDE